ncbi:MAG TPA: insulinase family protein [Myxococcales bacterium]|nr:insulinase family protein [Myxococcales bacterium]
MGPRLISADSVAEEDVYYQKLENGLTLLLRETHRVPVANVQVWAGVGSADERPDEAGLAHFHEHMLFKGTPSRGVGEVAGEIEGAGGRVNAYTSFDVTVYHATVPSVALGTAVDVLADAVGNSIFDPEEIQREQQVVIEEIRRSEDSPGHVLSDLSYRQAYQVHPYRAPILGTPESVASLDHDRCVAFFQRWYAPDNLTWVAAGDFDARALAGDLAERFASARPAGARRSRAAEPRPDTPRSAVERRPFEAQRFDLSWPSARFRDPDATYLDLLAFVLGECESSRLVRNIREGAALVDRIDCSSYTPYDRGLFSIGLESNEARSRAALEAIAAEVERLRIEPVSEDELERARANFLASEHFERESVSGMASKLGSFEVLGGDWQSETRYFETLRGATREDLLRVAQKYLAPEHLAAAALVPDQPGDTLDAEAMASALGQGADRARKNFRATPSPASPPRNAKANGSGASVPGKSERLSSGGLSPARVGSPASSRPATTGSPEAITSYPLPGGAVLHVASRRDIPVVALRAAFTGGLLAETEQTAGLSCFLASMWSRGTAKLSAAEFAEAVEDLAADISGFSGRSSLGLTLEATSDKLAPTLDLFRDVLLEPRFAPDEFERERRETLAAIDRREDQLAQRAFQLFSRTEFLEHPYRLPMLGDREGVEAFTPELVRAHHDRLIRAPNLVIAAAGDVDGDRLAEDLSERLAGLPGGEFQPSSPPEEIRAEGIRRAAEEKDRAQAHLVVGFRGLAVDDPDRFTLEIISQLLAGQGGRLFLDLRDRRSLAYSVSAMNVEGVAPGFFAVYIGCAPEKVEEARSGIFEHLEALVAAPPDADELARTQRNLVGNFAIDQQRSAGRAAHIALDALYGLGPTAHLAYPERVAAIEREDVLRVAQRILRMDAYTEALIRP